MNLRYAIEKTRKQRKLRVAQGRIVQGRLAWWLATCARKPKVPGSSPAASYAQRTVPPQQSPSQCLKCPRCGWKWQRGVKQIPTPFPYCPANRECSWKKTQIEKKKLSRKPLSHILYLHFLRIHHDYFFRRAFQSVRAQFPSGNVSGNQSCL